MTNWYELAERWKDRCVTCGEDNQRLVTFSQCINCRIKEREHEKAKNEKTKDS